jgi:hypothetical protein
MGIARRVPDDQSDAKHLTFIASMRPPDPFDSNISQQEDDDRGQMRNGRARFGFLRRDQGGEQCGANTPQI